MIIPPDLSTARTSKRSVLAIGLLTCSVLCADAWAADGPPSRPLIEDTKLYFTAPLRWETQDWMQFVGTVFTIGVAHEFDRSVRHAFEPSGGHPLDGQDPNSTRDAIPALALVAGTWVVGVVSGDKAERHEAWNMAEAVGFSAVDTVLLKYISGRRRPNETESPDEWFQGGDSFPSLHVSAAFAAGTVFAESGEPKHRWIRRTVGYGIAGATAYARLHDNAHWFSDVVAGAAIGVSTALFVVDRDRAATRHAGFSVVPVKGGAMLTYWRAP